MWFLSKLNLFTSIKSIFDHHLNFRLRLKIAIEGFSSSSSFQLNKTIYQENNDWQNMYTIFFNNVCTQHIDLNVYRRRRRRKKTNNDKLYLESFFSLSSLRLLNNEHMALYTSCSYRYLIKGAYWYIYLDRTGKANIDWRQETFS